MNTRQAAARHAAALLLLLALAACAVDPYRDYDPLPEAVQRPHPAGRFAAVPHTDRSGAVLDRFETARSFFPLTLGGALVDYDQRAGRGFQAAFAADFNSVSADPEQPLQAMLTHAEASRLQLLQPQRDVAHAALLDASAAVVVAMPRDPAAAVDAFAATARNHRDRPVWALLPAYAKAQQRLLEPPEARALAFTAIVAGASGLIWQGEDNYAARNAGALGISPQPRLDYGIRTGSVTPLTATPEAVAAARRLWDAVAQINRRIARIAPALLQPDAAESYSVAVQANRPFNTPSRLRMLLKAHDGGLLLIVVNASPVADAFRVAMAFAKVARMEEEQPVQQDPARGLFRDRIEAYGVQIYRIATTSRAP